MNYWLDLFTGTTWDEYLKAGGRISGFRNRMRNTVNNIQPDDILLCYVTGVMRWIGALKVIGPCNDKSKIWKSDAFPARLEVEPIIILDPKKSVPMEKLEGHVEFYQGPKHRGGFKGFVRRSPNLFKNPKEGEFILNMLRDTKSGGEEIPIDPIKWARSPTYKAKIKKGKNTLETEITIPEREEAVDVHIESVPDIQAASLHSEIQFGLLKLGSEMGYRVWVAKNDRGRLFQNKFDANTVNLIDDLPTQFDTVTNKVIEMIDVLWLKGNSIIAAFEIECTTSIYSGLLRMSDLLALQPNININLYIVAPEERRRKVRNEILRATFRIRENPLSDVCGFISIEELLEKVNGLRELGLISSIKPEFLDELAEYFTEESEL